MRVPHIDTQRWPVRLCELTPGLYAVRMTYQALVEAATRDLADTHIDLAQIKQTGYIDVQAFPQNWKYVVTLVTYWAALGLSQQAWGSIDPTERWRRFRDIHSVVANCGDVMDIIKKHALRIMSLPDSER